MDARTVLSRGLSTGLRLGRGAADRVVTVAGPTLARLGDKAVARLRPQEPAGTATFTPSKATAPATAGAGDRVPTRPGTPGPDAGQRGPQRRPGAADRQAAQAPQAQQRSRRQAPTTAPRHVIVLG